MAFVVSLMRRPRVRGDRRESRAMERPLFICHPGSRFYTPTVPRAALEQKPWFQFVADNIKYIALGGMASLLVLRHDAPTIIFIAGAQLNTVVGKFLKWVLNEERPPSTTKTDPGMPSSHALNLMFLSSYLAIDLWGTSNLGIPFAASILSIGAIGSVSRVFAGYHTWSQILIGSGVGITNGLLWHYVSLQTILPSLESVITRENLKVSSAALLSLGALLFFYKNEDED